MLKLPSPVKIRRSPKAKRLRLAVKPGVIELVIPSGIYEAQALAFWQEHRAWAEGKLAELNEQAKRLCPATGFADLTSLPWRGKETPLSVVEVPGSKIRVTVGDAITIILPVGLGESRNTLALRAFCAYTSRWLHGQVLVLASRHAEAGGWQPRSIRIKRMKTRWGSCGPRNDINLNWLLALAPEAVLEYVVIHELCHISERNHSPAFWSLVAQHCPDYAERRRWLKTQGGGLLHQFSV